MTVRQVSVEAYNKHISTGKALRQWMQIYELLKLYPEGLTRNEISEVSGVRIPSVCGRVNEMLKGQVVVEGLRRLCTVTKQSAHPVRVVVTRSVGYERWRV